MSDLRERAERHLRQTWTLLGGDEEMTLPPGAVDRAVQEWAQQGGVGDFQAFLEDWTDAVLRHGLQQMRAEATLAAS